MALVVVASADAHFSNVPPAQIKPSPQAKRRDDRRQRGGESIPIATSWEPALKTSCCSNNYVFGVARRAHTPHVMTYRRSAGRQARCVRFENPGNFGEGNT
jgi:hypothetical protein